MFLCNQERRQKYIEEGDSLKVELENAPSMGRQFISHQWLLDSIEKRMIYDYVYGDLLKSSGKNILDVGGGFCSLSCELAKKHEYSVLDIMAHDDTAALELLNTEHQRDVWIGTDWCDFQIEKKYDIIIANDLFPNVDQRLEMFLDKYLPYCNEMRLSLTYYNNDRVYKVKRVGADEIFHMVAWDNVRLLRSLEKYKNLIEGYNTKVLLDNPPSIFRNGRQVCVLTIRK